MLIFRKWCILKLVISMKKQRKTNEQKIDRRIGIYMYLVACTFLFIAYSLFKTIYLEREKHLSALEKMTDIVVEGESAPRGRIYDRNYQLLVDNEAVPTIIYKKQDKITVKQEIELAYQTAPYLELDFQKLQPRNVKEFYLAIHDKEMEQRITEEEREKVKRRILNNEDIYNLKIDRVTEEDLKTLTEEDLKVAYLYYLMNNGYSYQEKIIKENATDNEYSYFSENELNETGFSTKMGWQRKYLYGDTLKQILGTVGSISKEEKNEYLQKGYALTDQVGLSFIEKQYEDILKGTKATYQKKSSSTLEKITNEARGKDIVLTIDINLQLKVEEILKEQLLRAKGEANTNFLNKSYVVMQEPNTGEVLAMSGIQIIKSGKDYSFVDVTSGVLTDPMTPGSVVKGGSMLVGYNTGAIEIGEYKTDECIKIKSSPQKCSSHRVGRLNDITALAESSNVYQFKIAIEVGKGNYRYDAPLALDEKAFDIYRKTFAELGLGVKTEIDLPIESLGYIGSKKETNLLLNLSIGQYDTYTPIQLSQYITTLASNGKRVKPHLLKEVHETSQTSELGEVETTVEPQILNTVTTEQKYLDRVKEGFREVVKSGTGKGVMGIAPDPAGKTGTSESFLDTDGDGKIDTETVSNAFVGYAPASNPEVTIAVTTPDVENPNTSITFHSYVNRRIAKEICNFYFNEQATSTD